MTPEESAVAERAEAALKTNAEAYRLAQEAYDMRSENERLRAALERIVAIRGRGRWDGSRYDIDAEQDAEEMVTVARAALSQGAM